MSVGIDDHVADLGLQAIEHPLHHGLAIDLLQAFVNATHTTRKAAGKYDRGDVGGRYCHVLNRQARLLYTAQAACLRGAALKACDSVSISPVSVAS